MVPYYGDFAEDDTVLIPFNTFSSNDPSASVTITNLVAADIMVHKDGGLTQIATDGATVIIDFDGVTGNHLITIDTSAHADYATGSEYAVRIEGATVDAGTVNAWVGAFSLERAGGALAITKLIQAAVITNAAGVDIAADVIALKAETAVIVADTGELQTNQGNWLTATGFATPTNITAGTITTVTNLTNAPTTGDLTATMKTSVTTAATAATPIAASVTGAVGSVTGLTASNLDATVSSRMATTHLDATAGKLDGVALADTVTTYTGNTLQTKDVASILPVKNAAFNDLEWLWVAASDHVTPVTGATTMSVTRSIDGGAFGSGTGTGPTEVGHGIYVYDASAADMNGTIITFRFVATGGTPGAPDDAFLTIKTSG